jgi:DNA topoisomerase VI subunit B
MSKAAVKAAGKGDKLQQKSPAEFFAENKNIAGFDNVSAY